MKKGAKISIDDKKRAIIILKQFFKELRKLKSEDK